MSLQPQPYNIMFWPLPLWLLKRRFSSCGSRLGRLPSKHGCMISCFYSSWKKLHLTSGVAPESFFFPTGNYCCIILTNSLQLMFQDWSAFWSHLKFYPVRRSLDEVCVRADRGIWEPGRAGFIEMWVAVTFICLFVLFLFMYLVTDTYEYYFVPLSPRL